jgi:hypothetical protein
MAAGWLSAVHVFLLFCAWPMLTDAMLPSLKSHGKFRIPHRRCESSLNQVDHSREGSYGRATLISAFFSALIMTVTAFPSIGNAELGPLIKEKEVIVYFKGNPEFLKNPVLEAIRKIDQVDPDTEFQNVNKVILLVPIIDIEKDIQTVSKLITADASNLLEANTILTNKKFDTAPFKKTFNRYSDNIYYSDPERANIYLGGGAVPNTQQTTQYLFRNSALTAIGDIKEDVKLLLDDIKKNIAIDQQSVADAVDDCREALEALTSYLELADPVDVKEARSIVYSTPPVK